MTRSRTLDTLLGIAVGEASPDDERARELIAEHGLALLPVVSRMIRRRLPIEKLERIEAFLKVLLRKYLEGPTDGPTARVIARFQLSTGPLIKLKSYAVKAATPLGYSIFLQEPGEGFSFQRHTEVKTELFHIIQAARNAFVFICHYDEWQDVYDPKLLKDWLGGTKVERYDRYCVAPKPGDVFTIDRLNVVHSVFGCVLEEFATVSTDTVDRLYDQNAGRSIPRRFSRRLVEERLSSLKPPSESWRVHIKAGGHDRGALEWARVAEGCERLILGEDGVVASRFRVKTARSTGQMRDMIRAKVIQVWEGEGNLRIWDDGEDVGRVEALRLGAGAGALVPAGSLHEVCAVGSSRLGFSEHSIAVELAM